MPLGFLATFSARVQHKYQLGGTMSPEFQAHTSIRGLHVVTSTQNKAELLLEDGSDITQVSYDMVPRLSRRYNIRPASTNLWYFTRFSHAGTWTNKSVRI